MALLSLFDVHLSLKNTPLGVVDTLRSSQPTILALIASAYRYVHTYGHRYHQRISELDEIVGFKANVDGSKHKHKLASDLRRFTRFRDVLRRTTNHVCRAR